MALLQRLFGWTGDDSGAGLYGNYRLLDRIAIGRLSTLYRGEHVRTGEVVALKVLSEYGCRVADKLTRKLHKDWEGERGLKLQHPNVVRTIACGKEHEVYYLVMEYLAGGNLASLLQARAPTIEGRRIEVMRQAARGLEYVHSRGVIHRDICLRNVMLAGDGTAKLIDFGVAADRGDRIRDTGFRTGRPAYMAPELIRTNRFDERTDLYAFGIALYEVACGQKPYRTTDDPYQMLATVLNTEVPPPSRLRPSLSKRLERVILRAIEPRREARFASVTELLDALEHVTEDDL